MFNLLHHNQDKTAAIRGGTTLTPVWIGWGPELQSYPVSRFWPHCQNRRETVRCDVWEGRWKVCNILKDWLHLLRQCHDAHPENPFLNIITQQRYAPGLYCSALCFCRSWQLRNDRGVERDDDKQQSASLMWWIISGQYLVVSSASHTSFNSTCFPPSIHLSWLWFYLCEGDLSKCSKIKFWHEVRDETGYCISVP